VRISVDHGERGRPKRFDPQKPIFPQLEPWVPPWKRDHVKADVVTPDGTLVGMMVMERRGAKWAAATGGFDYGLAAEISSQRTQAEAQLVSVLGGSVDETAAVDHWLLGRKGSHEAGIIPWTPQAVGLQDKVYSGAELASQFASPLRR
jgi:hypothetical protein